MMASLTPDCASSFRPRPSRLKKAFSHVAFGAEVEAAVGHHAIDVEAHQADFCAACVKTRSSDHLGAEQVVHVEGADQLAGGVGDEQTG